MDADLRKVVYTPVQNIVDETGDTGKKARINAGKVDTATRHRMNGHTIQPSDTDGLVKQDCPKPEKDDTAHVIEVSDDPDMPPLNWCGRGVAAVEDWFKDCLRKNRKGFIWAIKILLLFIYLAYYIYCMSYKFGDEGSIILTVITSSLAIKIFADWFNQSDYRDGCLDRLQHLGQLVLTKRTRVIIRYSLYTVAIVGVGTYVGVDVLSYSSQNAQALIGIGAIIVGCFLFSARPSRVNWHPVFWGFLIQFILAIITLRTTPGYKAFTWLGDLVNDFVRLSDKGSNFVLGASFRATAPGFFFETAGVIVFFNAMIFVADYVGILEFIILSVGRGLAFCLETGPIESVVAAANIFIGLSEAPLLVRPYLPVVTRSELHAIMTCGFSSISGAFMAMFIAAGRKLKPIRL